MSGATYTLPIGGLLALDPLRERFARHIRTPHEPQGHFERACRLLLNGDPEAACALLEVAHEVEDDGACTDKLLVLAAAREQLASKLKPREAQAERAQALNCCIEAITHEYALASLLIPHLLLWVYPHNAAAVVLRCAALRKEMSTPNPPSEGVTPEIILSSSYITLLTVEALLSLHDYSEAAAELRAFIAADPTQHRAVALHCFNLVAPDLYGAPPERGERPLACAMLWENVDPEIALQLVSRVLYDGLVEPYGTAPAFALQGRLLEKLGHVEAACEAYADAAHQYGLSQHPHSQLENLERARALRLNDGPPDWAYAIAIQSCAIQLPIDPESVKSAARTWIVELNKTRKGYPEDEEALYIYEERATLNHLQAHLPGADAEGLLWEAARWLVCRIARSTNDYAEAWRLLAQTLRYLGLYHSALAANSWAIRCDSGADRILEEQIHIAYELGDHAEAKRWLAKLASLAPQKGRLLAARVHLLDTSKGNLNVQDRQLFFQEGLPWQMELLAHHLRLQGEWRAAFQVSALIFDLRHEDNYHDRPQYAVAALYLALTGQERQLRSQRLQEAEEGFRHCSGPAHAAFQLAGQGLCALVAGRSEEAEDALCKAGSASDTPRLCIELKHVHLAVVRSWYAHQEDDGGRLAVIERVANSLIVPRVKAMTYEQELQEIITTWSSDAIPSIGATACLALLLSSCQRWAESARLYEGLIHRGNIFPEAKLLFRNASSERAKATAP